MKTFADINFKFREDMLHPCFHGSLTVKGIELSVMHSKSHYSDGSSFEVAAFNSEGQCIPLSAADDVKGWQTPEEISKLIQEIEQDRQWESKLFLKKNLGN